MPPPLEREPAALLSVDGIEVDHGDPVVQSVSNAAVAYGLTIDKSCQARTRLIRDRLGVWMRRRRRPFSDVRGAP